MGFIINPYQVQPSGPSYGTLTTAWITATGETDLTILGALNTLESDLSTYGLTSKIKALYPFVGGTATKHKYNFMDARDLDAAYRLSFNGGWTHGSTGITGNGVNSFADAYITNSAMSYTSTHLSIYSRTDANNTGISIGNTSTYYNILWLRTGGNSYFGINSSTTPSTSSANSLGFYVGSRTSNTSQKMYKNGSVIITDTTTENHDNTTNYIGAAYRSGVGALLPDAREYAFASIGDGLTDTEAANFYTAVQAFQTTLSRNV